MSLSDKIKEIEKDIFDPHIGLPEEVFEFISRITPMVNVDLLIKDKNNRTLLSWRNDKYCGTGWSIAGGIVRYKENFNDRIMSTLKEEIGLNSEFKINPNPIAINQIIVNNNTTRGHFISFLYHCVAEKIFEPNNFWKEEFDVGYLQWFDKCPDNLIEVHNIYRRYI